MLTTREYIEKHGKPLAYYSDKHSVNNQNGTTIGTTLFSRVLHGIGVELFWANSPQVKGRVE